MIFFLRGCMVLCVERLHDFMKRVCAIYLTHSGSMIYFFGGCMILFVERLLGDCVIFCVMRLHDFLCEEVAWFFLCKEIFL